MKVFNNTDRALPVERWTIFPKSTRCVNQQGKVREELPDEVAYGSVIKRLEAQGVVVLPSFGKVLEVPAVTLLVKKPANIFAPLFTPPLLTLLTLRSEPVVEVDAPKRATEKRKKWK